MTSATETFAGFLDALAGAPCRVPLRVPAGVDPERRLAVYRNNRLGALRVALEQRYPVSRQVLGETCFQALVRDHTQEHPARQPALAQYGRTFPRFLAEAVGRRESLASLPWLPELAELEDLVFRARHTRRGPRFDFATFAGTPEPQRAGLRFALAPQVGIMRCHWNVDALHAAHEAAWLDGLSLQDEPVFLVVDHRDTHRIGARPFALLRRLASGATLGELQANTPEHAVGRVVRSLVEFIEQGWVTGR